MPGAPTMASFGLIPWGAGPEHSHAKPYKSGDVYNVHKNI